ESSSGVWGRAGELSGAERTGEPDSAVFAGAGNGRRECGGDQRGEVGGDGNGDSGDSEGGRGVYAAGWGISGGAAEVHGEGCGSGGGAGTGKGSREAEGLWGERDSGGWRGRGEDQGEERGE